MAEELTVIAGILADWQEQLERGEAVDVESVLSAHPSLADELKDGYAALAQLAAAQPPRTYERGETIAGRYEVCAVLGEGATATVYRVYDRTSEEEIAVKIVKGPVGSAEMLRHEVQLARKVTHPNVCRVFDIVEHEDGVLLSMELAADTLQARAAKPLDDDAVAEVARQILDGLEAAHAAGVVHRDLKPGNVLVGSDGRLQLTDFGLAKSVTQALASQEGWAGTPAYMAPEQLRGETPDERSDLYAVGLLLYRLRQGHLPFVPPGESPAMPHVIRRLEEAIPPFSNSRLDSGIARLLAPDPNRRPQDVDEARRALGLAAAEETVLPRAWRWLALAIVVALGAAGLALWRGRGGAPHVPVPARTGTVVGAARAQVIEDPVAFTPDGEGLVVSMARTGEARLWLVDLDGNREAPLTDGKEPAHAPQLTGGYLYYRRGADLVRVPDSRALRGEIWSGTEVERVIDDVVHAHVSASGLILLVPLGRGRQLDLLDPVTRERHVLVDDVGPIGSAAWSPDGRRIAYGDRPYGEGERAALWLVDPSSGATTRLAPAPHFTGLAWTPDGRGLVCFEGSGDERALVHHDLETGDAHMLIARVPDAALPAIGPDGQAAYLVDPWRYDLWGYADGELVALTNLGDRAAVSPHWVGSEGQLVYGVYPPDRRDLELRETSAPSFAASEPLRTIPACFESLTITPDGRGVFYTERRDDGYALFHADVRSSASPVELLRSTHPVWATAVTPAGRVCYTDESSGLSLRDVAPDGTDPRVLAEGAGGGRFAPDGGWLSYQRAGTPTGIRIQRTSEAGLPLGEAHPVPGERPLLNAAWWPGRPVLVVMDERELAGFDAEHRTRETILTWPGWVRDPAQLAVHRDGRMAFSLAAGRTTVKLVKNFADLVAATR